MKKKILLAIIIILITGYIAGILSQLYKYSQKKMNAGIMNDVPIEINFRPNYVAKEVINKNGIMIWLMTAILIMAGLYLIKNQKKMEDNGIMYSKQGTHGTAGWMEKEKYNIFDISSIKKNTGIILGKEGNNIVSLPLETHYNKHIAVFGASGTGKSRTFVRNNILQLSRTGQSIIITDPKGEIYRDTSEYLKSIGYTVKIFNLTNPWNSDRWNPLGEIVDDITAQTFAQVVIANTNYTAKPGGDLFWDRAEQNLLKALCLYIIKEYPEGNKNMESLYNILACGDSGKIDKLFDKLSTSHPAKHPYNIYKQANENVRTGVIIGLGTRLQVFQNEIIKKMTATSDVDLELPGKQKCAYYCVISDIDSSLDFLASLFFSFLFIKLVKYSDMIGQECNPQVYFILDEFPNIGQIPDFTKKISTIRSRGLNVSIIFQNIAQLENRYPQNQWQEIIGNCDTKLFLGCTDILTAKFVSEILGKTTITEYSYTKEMGLEYIFDFGKRTDRETSRYLLNPDEVLRFPNDKALVMLRGQKPLKVEKMDYTKHFLAKKLVQRKTSEYIPEWVKEKQQLKQEVITTQQQQQQVREQIKEIEESKEVKGFKNFKQNEYIDEKQEQKQEQKREAKIITFKRSKDIKF